MFSIATLFVIPLFVVQMKSLEQEILELAVQKGLLHPDDLQIDNTVDPLTALVEQGKLTNANLDSLKAELLDEMKTIDHPLWALPEKPKSDQKDEVSIAVFGRYVQLRLIGRGGMARVYRGFDPTLGRTVALKLLDEESERLMLEARSQARVEHENVCKVFEVGEAEGKKYICMQYVEGQTLADAAKQMNLTEKLEVMRKIADAVHAAHKQDLVHRDIKPGNIMLEKTEAGTWKPYILDFGLARMQTAPGITQKGVVIGTPHYMPPEQARSETIDVRSDVYSLGATLYELIANKPPFTGTTPGVILQVINVDPISLRKIVRQISPDLETIVMKCLEKDPAARYQSSKALANDLGRYLDGEPIAARPVSLSTRIWKKAKKNPVATGILTTALVVTAGLIVLLILAQWKGRIQTQYANDFAEEIRYIEAMLLSTYTAPLHDVRPKLTLARQRLNQIEKRTSQGGKWAFGPGNNALGQGFLMLKEYERAQEFLEKAWNSGYHSPSTAYALGKVKGILWRQALIDADRLTSRSLQAEAKKKADEKFRRPAILFLKNVHKHTESPAYVESLIFLYEKNHKEAFEKSRRALEISSRPYEVLKLQGDIHFETGQAAAERGDYNEALKEYRSAGDSYKQASEFARSDQDIYLADTERWIRTYFAQTQIGERLDSLQTALEACDKAIQVQPDKDRSYLYKSEIYTQHGINQLYSSGDARPSLMQGIQLAREAATKNPRIPDPHITAGNAFLRLAEYETANSLDPRASFKEAIVESQKALQLDPEHAEAHINLATAYFWMGEYELGHGENPIASLKKVIEILEKNLATFKLDDYAYNLLGLTYLDIGEYRLKRGEDPRPDLTKAIDSYQAGLKINPNATMVCLNMGLAYLDIAKYEMDYGIDPSKNFGHSIQQYDRAIVISSTNAFAHHDRGSVFILRAEHKIRLGVDPTSDFENAIASYNKASEINSELTLPHISRGTLHFLAATNLLNSGKDPTGELKSAKKSLDAYLKIDESHSEAFRVRGLSELLGARWEIQNRGSPEQFFKRAIADIQKAIELNKSELALYNELADTYRWEAEWELSQNRSAAASINHGFEAIENASKVSATHPETMAVRGVLKLLAARDAQKIELAKEASQLLTQAITANPFLKREFDPLLKQAENFKHLKN
jgi:serine/threonine-protein kinase